MNRLREARFKRRITQLLLFKKIGIWPSRISAIENGLMEPRQDEKRKLAKALGVLEDWLFPPVPKSKKRRENLNENTRSRSRC